MIIFDHFPTLIPCSVKYFLEACAHFILKVATKDSFRYENVKKLLLLTLKFCKQEQRTATKKIYVFLTILERFFISSVKDFLRLNENTSLEVATKAVQKLTFVRQIC